VTISLKIKNKMKKIIKLRIKLKLKKYKWKTNINNILGGKVKYFFFKIVFAYMQIKIIIK
jgi:menaquinone-dependent protoporphyrinogen IX oxidase